MLADTLNRLDTMHGWLIAIGITFVVLIGAALWLAIHPDREPDAEHEFEQSDDVFTGWDDEERAA